MRAQYTLNILKYSAIGKWFMRKMWTFLTFIFFQFLGLHPFLINSRSIWLGTGDLNLRQWHHWSRCWRWWPRPDNRLTNRSTRTHRCDRFSLLHFRRFRLWWLRFGRLCTTTNRWCWCRWRGLWQWWWWLHSILFSVFINDKMENRELKSRFRKWKKSKNRFRKSSFWNVEKSNGEKIQKKITNRKGRTSHRMIQSVSAI